MATWQQIRKNPELIKNLKTREKVISSIREFFHKEGFMEVETSLLVPGVIPESYLSNFQTILYDRFGKSKRMFLTASPESSLKKLLVAGIDKCFEITKSFRNGETGSSIHTPEFTMLEWYMTNASYIDLMEYTEKMIHFINANQRSKEKNKILYQNKTIDITSPWERISVPQALKKYALIEFDDIADNLKGISRIATKKGYQVSSGDSWEKIFNQIFLNEVEPNLCSSNKPVFLYDYPRPLAALARLKKEDNRLAERVELYIGNLELGDGYSELTDYKEQKKRFSSELGIINKKRKTEVLEDEDFLLALQTGLPPCAGLAMGLDRLVMLFCNTTDILDVKFVHS